ncbi:MAG: hypothetical protein WKH97_07650 [Casimicrobiaceae bacterium]
MSKLLSILCGVALIGISASAVAADTMKQGKGKGMDMKMMDTNNDGMVSRDEFMKHHEATYEKMKKNKDGMVDMKDMGMMQSGMKDDKMMKGSAMKDDKMMKSGAMKDDKTTQGGMRDATPKK